MRIYADINRLPNTGPEPSSVIVQVAPTPPVGATTGSNGKFYVDVPDGVFPPAIGADSRLLGPSPANIVPSIYGGLLARFPAYNYVRYNALLTSADVDLLDLSATFPVSPGPPPVSFRTRVQVGRGGILNAGLAPNSVAVLPQNGTTTPVRPGCLITDTIDISGDLPGGASSFLVYWKIHQFVVTPDVMAYDGPGVGTNEAASKKIEEIDQEPADFEVWISANDGGGYSRVRRLAPVTVCDPGTEIRLAFLNKSPTLKRYLAAYALIY